MKLIMPILAAAMLTGTLSWVTQAQPAASSRLDDSTEGALSSADKGSKTDSEVEIGSASLADLSSGPIAYGVVLNDGTKQSGTNSRPNSL